MLTAKTLSSTHKDMLAGVKSADEDLTRRFAGKMCVNHDLNRMLVSFQGNKSEIGHRWCKYREGFSADLVRYIIEKTNPEPGTILDPFAGSGTTLFVASDLGFDATGIELLPSGAEIIDVRHMVRLADKQCLTDLIRRILADRLWILPGKCEHFAHLRITAGAFPEANEYQLGRFLYETSQLKNRELHRLLRLAAMSVLEQISYTRKDGQYLRWDQRSGRSLGKKIFDKGLIYTFDDAITQKLNQIIHDIQGNDIQPMLFSTPEKINQTGHIQVKAGSCLDILPTLQENSISGLITSPPYCNRYDYTRTYALELAMLNVGEEGIRTLRQAMLSCTVENKAKADLSAKFGHDIFSSANEVFQSQHMLWLIIAYLDKCKEDETINNPGIVRMVKNYFFELTLLIFSSAKVLKKNAPFVMVNDNVRYEGAHIPADLILSDIAEQAGFHIERIWVLPRGKGNSSQQMGLHGRHEIRKCVYVWRKK
jgi:hypothetical protein